MNEIIDTIERSLRVIDFHIRKKGREVLRQYDITAPQFRALQMLLIHGDQLSVGELSDAMSLATSTVTSLVNRMEQLNLVRKVPDENDGRMVRVEVLMKGHEIVEEIILIRREFLEKIMEPMEDEAHDALAKYLPQLMQEFRKNEEKNKQ